MGQLDIDEDEIKWPNALGGQNLETLNMCYQTYQIGLSMAPLVGVTLPKCILKRSKLDWFANEQQSHEVLDFPIQDS